ncbi:MAG: MFS transporter [Vicinamibacterales bacterium]
MSQSTPADAAPAPDVPSATTIFGSKALHRMFAAFTYRDFRVQWIGACTSSVGTWVQITAQNWMVTSLATEARAAFFLGLDSFLQQLPIMLLTLVGGVLADCRDRRRTLLSSQYLQMATAAALALLVYLDVVTIPWILTLSFVTGVAQAFGGPAYQTLVPSLVDKKDLPNAVALNSIQFNIARVIGPLLFGVTIAAGASWGLDDQRAMALCFAINAASFLVVIYTLMSLRVKFIPPAQQKSLKDELTGGIQYVREQSTLIALIVLAASTTFLGFAVLTFLPLFTKSVFREGANTYSHLLAFSGAGSVAGALVVAWLGKFRRMGLTVLLVQVAYGLFIVAFAMSRAMWLSDLLLFLTGAALMMVFSTVTSLVQLTAPNEMRGRVMSIYMLAFRGGMPLGSLASGWAATYIGAPAVLEINGVLLVAVAIYFLFRSHGVREI